MEKALRSEAQKQEHVACIFSGSEQRGMLDMVRDSKRAFCKLGRIMKLGPIRRNHTMPSFHRTERWQKNLCLSTL